MNTHTLSLLVENRHGALSRVANLFSSRGYNITSLNVAETEDPTISRMTIVVAGEESILEQVIKQLNKLIDVIKVLDFVQSPIIDRELALICIDTSKGNRTELLEVAGIFGASVNTVGAKSLTLEMLNTTEAIDDFIALIRPYGIRELARSGKVAMVRNKN